MEFLKATKEKELGNAAYKKKDFEMALKHYGRAIELDPTNIVYRNNQAGKRTVSYLSIYTASLTDQTTHGCSNCLILT